MFRTILLVTFLVSNGLVAGQAVVPTCPSPAWHLSAEGTHCYAVFGGTVDRQQQENWQNADGFCRNLGANGGQGNLAALHSVDDLTIVVNLAQETNVAGGCTGNPAGCEYGQTWIGLRYDQAFDWAWSDGSPVDYTNWFVGQPTGYRLPSDPNNIRNNPFVSIYTITTVTGYMANSVSGSGNQATDRRGYACQTAPVMVPGTTLPPVVTTTLAACFTTCPPLNPLRLPGTGGLSDAVATIDPPNAGTSTTACNTPVSMSCYGGPAFSPLVTFDYFSNNGNIYSTGTGDATFTIITDVMCNANGEWEAVSTNAPQVAGIPEVFINWDCVRLL